MNTATVQTAKQKASLALVAHEQSHAMEDIQALLEAAELMLTEIPDDHPNRWKVVRIVRVAHQRLDAVHAAFQDYI